jgi:endonuclease/exonuclease/phosphatase family metal-dependent hydrolase
MAIPPVSTRGGASEDYLGLAKAVGRLDAEISPDIYGFQEVDHFLPRSQSRPQMRDIAEAIGARDWAMAPGIIGTPAEKWRALNSDEPQVITNSSSHLDLMHECYGIGIVSKIPVRSWHRLNLGNSPIGMPLIVPGDESGRGRPRFIYVRDEPRVAIAAVLDNGWVVVNTHLSFVPVFNLLQLKKLKRWTAHLGLQFNSRTIIMGDLNLPNNLPVVGSEWNSLVSQKTYPSWGAKIQFDYILAKGLQLGEYHPLANSELPVSQPVISNLGISDHLPVSVEILN